MSDDRKKIITDPKELRLTVDARQDVLVLGPDEVKSTKLGWTMHEIRPGSPEEAALDAKLDPTRWTDTDEADRFFSNHGVESKTPDRIGWTEIEVLPFLKGRPWNNAALNVVMGLRPSCIRVTTGEVTLDSRPYRVTVTVASNRRTIREITQEVEVGLIGCRYGADVSAYIDGRVPPTRTPSVVFNPRAAEQARKYGPITINENCRCTCTPCKDGLHGVCNFRCDDANWRTQLPSGDTPINNEDPDE